MPGKPPGIDLQSLQNVVDGTLCRAPSPRPGAVGIVQSFTSQVAAATNPAVFVYCNLWSEADRTAFWRGFGGRVEEFGKELHGYFVWFRDAFGFGANSGDAQRAWGSLADALGALAELAWKLTVVAGVPPPMLFHPRRQQYAQELADLGLQLTEQLLEGYRKAWKQGGVPQCAGVLLADLLRLIFEIFATKGLARGVSAVTSGKLLARLPGPLRKIPVRIKEPPSRTLLITYIQHGESMALHARGVLLDLKPGQFVVRVEASAAKLPGNWFNGPFNTRLDAERYAKYLADLGESGIRRESALPRVWDGGGQGNAIEVVRIYQVEHPTPAISSVVAPQREGGKVMATAKHYAALKSKNPMDAAEYAGQGQQLSLPVSQARKVHELELVRAVPGAEIRVTRR